MQDLNAAKQQEIAETPLFLFECAFADGSIERWSTHSVTVVGDEYRARVLGHNAFELKSSLDDGADGASKITVSLANADSYFSEIQWNKGWKGARITVRFLFFDLVANNPATENRVVFRGKCGDPDEITESTLKITFTNQLNLQRTVLPEVRIQKRCPWAFPATEQQRRDGIDGAGRGKFGRWYRCGYAPDIEGGSGNRNSDGELFTSCDYTRAQCQERGMFDEDSAGNPTRRFGGVEFVPPVIQVRSYGEKGSHVSAVLDNEARYNDVVPLVYGTAWFQPPVVFARNDGNLTRFEVLLGGGEMEEVLKVIVNDIEIPQGVAGANMTATGWFHTVTPGGRTGVFNPDFTDGSGQPLGDPYGSLAALSVVVPNRISSGQSLPRVSVLVRGLKLATFDGEGQPLGESFTNNPAWVLADVLARSGWSFDDLDLASFAATAAYCEEPLQTLDAHGNPASVPRYQCNLVIRSRRSAADVVRGIRNGSSLMLGYSGDGKLRLRAETSLAAQQANRVDTSNSSVKLNDGWPAYEFSDGSAPFSGIVRRPSGEPALRFWSRGAAETLNRFSVEFQDEFNEYQQDSLSLVDIDDATLTGREVTAPLTALGVPNFDQATRVMQLQLDKSIRGNAYVEFTTSVRGFGLAPGDIIALTYEKEGMVRQPFRVTRIVPGVNYRTAVITAQIHDDAWYGGPGSGGYGGRRQPAYGIGIPRPLIGKTEDADGRPQFEITETVKETADGANTVALSVAFSAPGWPVLTGVGIPLLGLSPTIHSTGGSLQGGQTFYYAVSAVDAQGGESRLSFTARATLPDGSDLNSVTLTSLSFSAGTASFHVYRGPSPGQLARIASNVVPAASFIDDGTIPAEVVGPPDENYDHANFYWRLELQPESTVDAHSANTIGNSALHMLTNEDRGAVVRITRGRGEGQERAAIANDETTLTVSPKWDIEPDATSAFVVTEASWRFGALTVQGPAEFEAPNRANATVHVLGRSANVHDQECAIELSPLTRWRIGGGGASGDSDVPPLPMFGLIPVGHGTVEAAGFGFLDLTNTRTVMSGTLGLLYWDELEGAAPVIIVGDMSDGDVSVTIAVAGATQANAVLQIGKELMVVSGVDESGTVCSVERGAYGTAPAGHGAGTAAYVLARRTYIIPFARDYFGSPSSGSYSYPVHLPDVRIAAAELFVTNDRGNSPTARVPFTSFSGDGIRTLSGGQFSIQVDGILAIQNDAAPTLSIDERRSVRDVYALITQPTSSGPIRLQLNQNNEPYCELVVPSGSIASTSVDGFALPKLEAKARLTLDILEVPQSPNAFPGADLTVTIRL